MNFNEKVKEICEKASVPFIVAYEDIDNVTEEEYIKIRMNWFGASDSSKLLDVNPFPNGSSQDLLMEKLTRKHDESIGKKASVRMGKDVEHIILAKVQEYFKDMYEIDKPKDMYGNETFRLGVNFDAVAIDKNGVAFPIEIKTVTKYGRKHYNFDKAYIKQKDGEWLEDVKEPEPIQELLSHNYKEKAEQCGIPVYYYTQLQQQILALNATRGYLAVLDADNWDVNIFKIKKDIVCQTDLIAKANKFSERLKK